MIDDEDAPIPAEISVQLPRNVAIALWAEAHANDRSMEYMAAKWLSETARKTIEGYEALEAAQNREPAADAIDTRKERLAMTRTLRLAVLRRDNFTCRYCGAGKEKKLHVDHIVAICNGGKTVSENLQTLCFECNLGKAAKPDANVVEIGLGRK